MSFQFIDNASIDRQTMRKIRSHAAKGKNIGKGRPRKKPFANVRPPSINSETRTISSDESIPLEHPVGSAIDLIPITFDLDVKYKDRMCQMLGWLSSDPLGGPLSKAIDWNLNRSLWASFIFIDEAYFYCNIAMLNIVLDASLTGDDESAESIQHLNQTFRLVNAKLSSSRATDTSTFAAVLAMTHYYRLRNDHDRGLIHLTGLERMVSMVGGIRNFCMINRVVAQKVFRTDLEFAIQLGSRTRFSASDFPAKNAETLLESIAYTQELRPDIQEICSSRMQETLLMMLKLCIAINHAYYSADKLVGEMFHDTIIYIGYRLVDICPLSDLPLLDETTNLLFLGLCAFQMTFLPGLNHRIPSLPVLKQAIRSAFDNARMSSKLWHELCIWILLIGRTTVFHEDDEAWLLSAVSSSTRSIGSKNLTEIKPRFSGLPWIDILHDHTAQQILDSINNT